MRIPAVAASGVFLAWFYVKYVPLVVTFQLALAPLCLAALALAAFNRRAGVLFFVFAFPLVNGLPYFFGIAEPTPHAPAALVLFLFFFLGWLLHGFIDTPPPWGDIPVLRPMRFFAALVAVSALIVMFRAAGFFPFRAGGLYELAVNVEGVRSGGAVMSALFFSLNHLTGFALFLILLKALDAAADALKLSFVLCLSAAAAMGFGLVQFAFDPRLGNNPTSIREGLLNATFKDGISLGAFAGLILPLALGLGLSSRGARRAVAFAAAALTAFMAVVGGSRAGLLSCGLAVIIFVLFAALRKRRAAPGRGSALLSKKGIAAAAAVLAVALVAAAGILALRRSAAPPRTLERLDALAERGWEGFKSSQRASLWRIAGRTMVEYPLSGVGVGGFIIEVSNLSRLTGIPIQCTESAENYFLQVGAETGWIGLALVLWMFWEILRAARRARSGKSHLVAGAAAGILAFLVNIQFHSYIGSFEVIYAFWLLAAVVVRTSGAEAGAEAAAPKSAGRGGRILRLAALAAVVLSCVSLLWCSTRSLSLESRSARLDLDPAFGFYERERTPEGREFRWTREYGGLRLPAGTREVAFPIHASHPDIARRPVAVRARLLEGFFGRTAAKEEITLGDGSWKTVTLRAPEGSGPNLTLLIEVGRTWKPLKETGAPDPRRLGVAVGAMEIR
ncbi:MAG: O-antigen ligase family protein [Candidatus Aminicenantes bacterium]|nr:O-antigen ligase family protein [Candidatus Aminicenantes bacterium]